MRQPQEPSSAPARSRPSRRDCLAGGLALCANASLPPILYASNAKTDKRRAPIEARGVNIPGWIDGVKGLAPAAHVLQSLRQLGFNFVRLPIEPGVLLGGDGSQLLDRIDRALNNLNGWGFHVALDMHPGPSTIARFRDDEDASSAMIEAAWRRLAPVLAASSPLFNSAELLNEPAMPQATWIGLRDRLLRLVRAACPDHRVIWGAAHYQGIHDTIAMPLPTDQNTMAAIHYYVPIAFTHQCADWSGPALAQLRGLPFPVGANDSRIIAIKRQLKHAGHHEALDLLDQQFNADWTTQRIESDFAALAAWSHKTDCPVMLNEFGVFKGCADDVSRTAWIGAVRAVAEKHGIGWAYWELDHGFGLMADRRSGNALDNAILAALFG